MKTIKVDEFQMSINVEKEEVVSLIKHLTNKSSTEDAMEHFIVACHREYLDPQRVINLIESEL